MRNKKKRGPDSVPVMGMGGGERGGGVFSECTMAKIADLPRCLPMPLLSELLFKKEKRKRKRHPKKKTKKKKKKKT